jgi:hypothetical protein
MPLLVVLLLGITDFGRVFAAGVVVEAATRDAAEIAATDSRMVGLKDPTCDAACRAPIYAALHVRAAETACNDARRLWPTTDTSGGSCVSSGGDGLLLIGVCVHDSVTALPQAGDPACGEVTGGSVPIGCDQISQPWSNVQGGVAGAANKDGVQQLPLRYVEVRVCYRFTPMFRALILPINASANFGNVYIQKTRYFTVQSDY